MPPDRRPRRRRVWTHDRKVAHRRVRRRVANRPIPAAAQAVDLDERAREAAALGQLHETAVQRQPARLADVNPREPLLVLWRPARRAVGGDAVQRLVDTEPPQPVGLHEIEPLPSVARQLDVPRARKAVRANPRLEVAKLEHDGARVALALARAVRCGVRLPRRRQHPGPRAAEHVGARFRERTEQAEREAPERMAARRRDEEVGEPAAASALTIEARRPSQQHERRRAARDELPPPPRPDVAVAAALEVDIGVDAAENMHVEQPRRVGAFDWVGVAVVQRQQLGQARREALAVCVVRPQAVAEIGQFLPAGDKVRDDFGNFGGAPGLVDDIRRRITRKRSTWRGSRFLGQPA